MREWENHASLLFTNFNLPMFPSLDTVASEAISFEQMIVISTATMAQIHLMQAFQGLCHPLDVINRGKISFFHSRKREEGKREMGICLETQNSRNPLSNVSVMLCIMCLLERKETGWPHGQYLLFTDRQFCLYLVFIVKVYIYHIRIT